MTVADLHRAYRDELLAHGLLISMGVDGLYGRSGTFEAVVEGINRAVGAVGDADRPEVMRFPPGIGKWQLEQSGYLKSSPHLVGTVHSFTGSDSDHRAMLDTLAKGEDWTANQRTTEVALAPAACYGVYPAIGARGRLGAEGALVDCYTYCFRHEPSVDPARMQMFRQREHVRLGSEDQALAFREKWKARGQAIVSSFALPFEIDIANDPFFGRTGRLLAASQREESLKFELLVPIHATEHPTACVSFNYHRDLFGQAWKIETADGATAHTACVGFGVERITLALFKHHGLAVGRWPQKVRDVLGL
ncbi:MAG: amino acid--[acyl-carrier-protein] ligase [Reyranella sp.]|uniref:amino acid--[acyl-carrier-protein] ligase n=1 Tax=Reyranella sp. TaxID=1929291 RepID=UPI001AC7E547|nr:amino acid--[acyl-carrier-protein] ligase [Reyranella sp.]MBN9090668.1 amino acid--[acyl-carrier-protein] ligase [Reyranella sp.]